MKPTTNMTCLVLGHNYYKVNSENSNTDKIICKNCGVETYLDTNEDFSSSASKNKMFEISLRKLFLLKRRLHSQY